MTMHVYDPGFDYRSIPKSIGGGLMSYAKNHEDTIYKKLLQFHKLCREKGLDWIDKRARELARPRKGMIHI